MLIPLLWDFKNVPLSISRARSWIAINKFVCVTKLVKGSLEIEGVPGNFFLLLRPLARHLFFAFTARFRLKPGEMGIPSLRVSVQKSFEGVRVWGGSARSSVACRRKEAPGLRLSGCPAEAARALKG